MERQGRRRGRGDDGEGDGARERKGAFKVRCHRRQTTAKTFSQRIDEAEETEARGCAYLRKLATFRNHFITSHDIGINVSPLVNSISERSRTGCFCITSP